MLGKNNGTFKKNTEIMLTEICLERYFLYICLTILGIHVCGDMPNCSSDCLVNANQNDQ